MTKCPQCGSKVVEVWQEINYEFGTEDQPHHAILKVNEPHMLCTGLKCGFTCYGWQSEALRLEAVSQHWEKIKQMIPVPEPEPPADVLRVMKKRESERKLWK